MDPPDHTASVSFGAGTTRALPRPRNVWRHVRKSSTQPPSGSPKTLPEPAAKTPPGPGQSRRTTARRPQTGKRPANARARRGRGCYLGSSRRGTSSSADRDGRTRKRSRQNRAAGARIRQVRRTPETDRAAGADGPPDG